MEPQAISLKATGRARRRLLVNRVAEGSAILAAVLAIASLALVVWSVGGRGIGAVRARCAAIRMSRRPTSDVRCECCPP